MYRGILIRGLICVVIYSVTCATTEAGGLFSRLRARRACQVNTCQTPCSQQRTVCAGGCQQYNSCDQSVERHCPRSKAHPCFRQPHGHLPPRVCELKAEAERVCCQIHHTGEGQEEELRLCLRVVDLRLANCRHDPPSGALQCKTPACCNQPNHGCEPEDYECQLDCIARCELAELCEESCDGYECGSEEDQDCEDNCCED